MPGRGRGLFAEREMDSGNRAIGTRGKFLEGQLSRLHSQATTDSPLRLPTMLWR